MKTLYQLTFTCCLLVLLLSCAQQPVTIVKTVPSLRPSSIYNRDSVNWYLERHGNFHKEMAASYITKAKEAEPDNIRKAIYFTKRAITVQPDKQYYLYLLSLLDKAEQYEELSTVYELLTFRQYNRSTKIYQYLFDRPEEDVLYEFLAFTLTNGNSYMAGGILDNAQEVGISMEKLKKRLLADKRVNIRPGSDNFNNLLLLFMTDAEMEAYQNSPANFRNFIASIKDSSQVFEIDEKEAKAFFYRQEEWDVEMDFKHFFRTYLAETKETPDKWVNFQAKHRLRLNDGVQAVVYAVDTSATACPEEMRHIYHRLVTYNNNGDIIQSEVVAVQAGEQLSLMSFAGNAFTVTDFRRDWKNPYQKSNFDNYVVKKERVGERNYQIRGDGKIFLQEPLLESLSAEL